MLDNSVSVLISSTDTNNISIESTHISKEAVSSVILKFIRGKLIKGINLIISGSNSNTVIRSSEACDFIICSIFNVTDVFTFIFMRLKESESFREPKDSKTLFIELSILSHKDAHILTKIEVNNSLMIIGGGFL